MRAPRLIGRPDGRNLSPSFRRRRRRPLLRDFRTTATDRNLFLIFSSLREPDEILRASRLSPSVRRCVGFSHTGKGRSSGRGKSTQVGRYACAKSVGANIWFSADQRRRQRLVSSCLLDTNEQSRSGESPSGALRSTADDSKVYG